MQCLYCNGPINSTWGKKFCCQSHAAKYNNPRRPIRIKSYGKCTHCGKERKRNAGKFCSIRCKEDAIWERRLRSIYSTGTLIGGRSVARRFLTHRDGWACSICKGTEWLGNNIPLEVDHIDGNSQNNAIGNIRFVCGNCAMLLPTYKGKNKGNGRHSRMVRYKSGKSY